MKRGENIEQFFLKSLIVDLDVVQEQLDSDEIEEEKTTTGTPKSNFNDNNNIQKCFEEKLISPNSVCPSRPIISSADIFKSLHNQKLSLMIQNIVKSLNAADLSLLLLELKGKYGVLMKDKNGNYLCSDIFKVCNVDQRVSIIKEVSVSFI